jgi:hypothetical protein
MNSNTYWLVSLLYGGSIIDVIVIIDANDNNFDDENYMDPKNLEYVYSKLPQHIKSVGPILRIKEMEIFDIVTIKVEQ